MVQIAIFKSIQSMCVRVRIEVLSRNLMAELIGEIMGDSRMLHEVLKLAGYVNKAAGPRLL